MGCALKRRGYLLSLFAAGFYIALLAYEAHAQAPFPDVGTNPAGEVIGGFSVDRAKDAADASLTAVDDMWTNLVNPNSPYWQQMIVAMQPLFVVSWFVWVANFLYVLFRDKASVTYEKALRALIWPTLVVILSANNGQLMAASQYIPKAIIEGIDNTVLDVEFNGVPNRAAIQLFGIRSGIDDSFNFDVQSCLGRDGEALETCNEAAQDKRKSKAEQALNIFKNLPTTAISSVLGAGRFGFGQIKSAFLLSFTSILVSITSAFRLFMALALATWGLTSPIWLGITMLPLPTRGLITLISGYFALGMVTITHSMITAAAASMVALSNGSDLFAPAFITGFLSPITSVVIGSGSAIGLFIGLVGAAAQAGKLSASVLSKGLIK